MTEPTESELALIEEATRICEAAAGGDLEGRLRLTQPTVALSRFAAAVNALLDSSDAFVREARASLEHASHDRFYRVFVTTGLGGAFKQAAEVINGSTREMRSRTEELARSEQNRKLLADSFSQSVNSAIEALRERSGAVGGSSSELLAQAEASLDQSTIVAGATVETSATMKQLSESTNALSTSVSEIEALVARSTEVARDARCPRRERDGDGSCRGSEENRRCRSPHHRHRIEHESAGAERDH